MKHASLYRATRSIALLLGCGPVLCQRSLAAQALASISPPACPEGPMIDKRWHRVMSRDGRITFMLPDRAQRIDRSQVWALPFGSISYEYLPANADTTISGNPSNACSDQIGGMRLIAHYWNGHTGTGVGWHLYAILQLPGRDAMRFNGLIEDPHDGGELWTILRSVRLLKPKRSP